MADYYILDADHNAIPIDDAREWAERYERRDNRRVADTQVGNLWVSTVFMGLDHSFGTGPPLIFETMVFPCTDEGEVESWGEEYVRRYSTWAQAEQGHADAVEWAKGQQPTPAKVEHYDATRPPKRKLKV